MNQQQIIEELKDLIENASFPVPYDDDPEQKFSVVAVCDIETIIDIIKQNDENQILEKIFKYASGGYLENGFYSDQKIRKGQKFAMEELIERFFPKQKKIADARQTACEIAKKHNINELVLEQLKSFAK